METVGSSEERRAQRIGGALLHHLPSSRNVFWFESGEDDERTSSKGNRSLQDSVHFGIGGRTRIKVNDSKAKQAKMQM
jgi:hypothetical protein